MFVKGIFTHPKILHGREVPGSRFGTSISSFFTEQLDKKKSCMVEKFPDLDSEPQ